LHVAVRKEVERRRFAFAAMSDMNQANALNRLGQGDV
jgi:hypothetical protein